MTILSIAKIGEPILSTKARELSLDEIKSDKWQGFIEDLIETMHDANGAGIAATQVFEDVRICTLHVKAGNPRYPYKPEIPLQVLINPIVTPMGTDTFSNYEGCLSVPNLRGRVQRYAHVGVTYVDRNGTEKSIEAKGISAGTYQHEVDHLDGFLFTDRVEDSRTLCTWEVFDKYHREAFTAEANAIVAKYGS